MTGKELRDLRSSRNAVIDGMRRDQRANQRQRRLARMRAQLLESRDPLPCGRASSREFCFVCGEKSFESRDRNALQRFIGRLVGLFPARSLLARGAPNLAGERLISENTRILRPPLRRSDIFRAWRSIESITIRGLLDIAIPSAMRQQVEYRVRDDAVAPRAVAICSIAAPAALAGRASQPRNPMYDMGHAHQPKRMLQQQDAWMRLKYTSTSRVQLIELPRVFVAKTARYLIHGAFAALHGKVYFVGRHGSGMKAGAVLPEACVQ